MRLWRIASKVPGAYDAADLSGEGARREGARWNSPGVPALCTSVSASTAVLESLAHLGARKQPANRYLVVIEIPDRVFDHRSYGVKHFAATVLPKHWNADPVHQVSQLWGDALLPDESRIKAMRSMPAVGFSVPSVLVEEDINVVLNPRHPLVKKHAKVIGIRAFVFDRRLVLKR